MKNLMLTALITVFAGSLALAQTQREEVYPQQASIEHNQAVKTFSRDYVTLFANSSLLGYLQQGLMDVNQIGKIGVSGNNNTAYLEQNGNLNIGLINITGNNNEANLDQQGNRLYSNLNLIGNYNKLDVLQVGINLQNYIQLRGDNLSFNVEQTNSGLQLMQNGAHSIPLKIQQTGRIIPLIIQNH